MFLYISLGKNLFISDADLENKQLTNCRPMATTNLFLR